jgi:hypothetical protein
MDALNLATTRSAIGAKLELRPHSFTLCFALKRTFKNGMTNSSH